MSQSDLRLTSDSNNANLLRPFKIGLEFLYSVSGQKTGAEVVRISSTLHHEFTDLAYVILSSLFVVRSAQSLSSGRRCFAKVKCYIDPGYSHSSLFPGNISEFLKNWVASTI
jgi:hypothetical protein